MDEWIDGRRTCIHPYVNLLRASAVRPADQPAGHSSFSVSSSRVHSFVGPSVCPSILMFACLSVRLFVNPCVLSVRRSTRVPVYPYVHWSNRVFFPCVRSSEHLTVCPSPLYSSKSVHLSTHLSFSLSINPLFVRASMRLSTHLFVCPIFGPSVRTAFSP